MGSPGLRAGVPETLIDIPVANEEAQVHRVMGMMSVDP